jgi:hypothetical protein
MPGLDAIGHALLFGRTYSENTVQLSRNGVVYSSGFGVGSMMGRVHGILQACQGRVYEKGVAVSKVTVMRLRDHFRLHQKPSTRFPVMPVLGPVKSWRQIYVCCRHGRKSASHVRTLSVGNAIYRWFTFR